MRDRHDCPKAYIGSSDIAALVAVGSGDKGIVTGVINYGMDGSYNAYICDDEVEVPPVYKPVFECDHWLRIYDDEGKSYELNVPGKTITVYRAGEMGTLIKASEKGEHNE